jgi:uncharacterized protein
MKKVGILSDTHGFIPSQLFRFFENCDEIWHAGDWGDLQTYETLKKFKPIKGVWGNIDDHNLRLCMPEIIHFSIEGLNVCILHIGGYPGNYSPHFRKILQQSAPDLMVCGHSHILKVMRDKTNGIMHINPGAAGFKGFHKVCTAIRFKIENKRMHDMEIWEMPRNKLLVQPNE